MPVAQPIQNYLYMQLSTCLLLQAFWHSPASLLSPILGLTK